MTVNCLPMFLYLEVAIAFMYLCEAFFESIDGVFAKGSTAGHIVAIVFGVIFFVGWVALAYVTKVYAEDNMSAEKRRKFEEARRAKPKVARTRIQPPSAA